MLQDAGSRATYDLVGLGAAVAATVVQPYAELPEDGSVTGRIVQGRGGMVCNTLAVAASLGSDVAGVVAVGADPAGRLMRQQVVSEGVTAAFVETPATPVTMTLVRGPFRASVMGVEGYREQHLAPSAVQDAWRSLGASPSWVMLTLPALLSPAGSVFVELARSSGSSVAVTLSSVGHVGALASAPAHALEVADLLFGNLQEAAALSASGHEPALMLATDGPDGVEVHRRGGRSFKVPVPAPVQEVDTTGAGDAFAAGVLHALAASAELGDMALEEAALLGHRAAGVMVGVFGAQPGPDGAAALSRLSSPGSRSRP